MMWCKYLQVVSNNVDGLSFRAYNTRMDKRENKKHLTERDICTKYVIPALKKAGWDIDKQVREELYFTDGRIMVKGNTTSRAKGKKADIILYYKPNIPLAVIEIKDNNHSMGDGMQQALDYADILDVPVAYSTNGDGFIEHDKTQKSGKIETELLLDNFPGPSELWAKYTSHRGIKTEKEEQIAAYDYFFDGSGRKPRYYQQIAINRTVEAIAKGQDRILLVMATGTGKTYTAFQIIHRLWKSKSKKRILFLADRNALIDQTIRKDFRHFKKKMTFIKHKVIDKAYEIYLALYQGLSDTDPNKDAYKQFSPGFFDLVIVDECHRGSAADDSAWRSILEYFSSATQIGMTATPRETEEISNIDYFGEPIYTYSLKQGIDDGFLAPYKVLRVGINVDLEGYRPESGKKDKNGNPVPDEYYNRLDFDRRIVIDERTKAVAKKVTEFLRESGDRFAKTIIFCVDIDHAERMRQEIVNKNADLVADNYKYVMRITGDNELGKLELDNFIDPEMKYPVIATTSKLMTTGIDAETCKLIVLDSNIKSMTEFKQIIGRGTRIREDFGKTFFTIMDFRNVTNLFADPAFDGDPVMIKQIEGDEPITKADIYGADYVNPDEERLKQRDNSSFPVAKEPERSKRQEKIYVNGVDISILNVRIQYLNKDGELITESLKDYAKNSILKEFRTLNDFLNRWNKAESKQVIIEELEKQDIIIENLINDSQKDMDVFDLICHAAWGKPPLTRRERAENVKKRDFFARYEVKARQVLEALLVKYSDEGFENLEDLAVLRIDPFDRIGAPMEIVKLFGGPEGYAKAVHALENEIYGVA